MGVQFNTIVDNPILPVYLREGRSGQVVEVKDEPQETFPAEAPTSQNDLSSSSNVFNAKALVAQGLVDYDSLLDSEILDRVKNAVAKAFLRKAEELRFNAEQIGKLMTYLPGVVFMDKKKALRSRTPGYNISTNAVEITPFYIGDDKLDTPEFDGLHEGSHAVNSILLSNLSDEEIINAIKTKLLDEIVDGSPVMITRGEFAFYSPVITSIKLRQNVRDFMRKILNDLNDSNCLLRSATEMVSGEEFKTFALTKDGVKELDKYMQGDKDGYDEFLSYFNFDKEKALMVMKYYLDTQILRYMLAVSGDPAITFPLKIPKDVLNVDLKLTSDQKMHVVKSAEDFLYLSEGTLRFNAALGRSEEESVEADKDTILSYAFSPEEIEAKLMEINVALEDEFISAQTREQLEAAKAVFERGKELMDLRKELSIAPRNKEKYSLALDSICKKIELEQKMEEFFRLAEAVPSDTSREDMDELQEKLKIAAEAANLGFSMLGLNPEINNIDFDPINMLDEGVPSNIDLKERILTAENEIATNHRIANLNFPPIECFKKAA